MPRTPEFSETTHSRTTSVLPKPYKYLPKSNISIHPKEFQKPSSFTSSNTYFLQLVNLLQWQKIWPRLPLKIPQLTNWPWLSAILVVCSCFYFLWLRSSCIFYSSLLSCNKHFPKKSFVPLTNFIYICIILINYWFFLFINYWLYFIL